MATPTRQQDGPSSVEISSVRGVTFERYEQLDASDWSTIGEETDGRSEHRWFRRPGDPRPWLYKPVEIKDGHRQGEDWAEKAVSEIAKLMAVPAADIELAHRHGEPGLISRDIKPKDWDLQPGAALLGGFVTDYESRTRFRAGHNLGNIVTALAQVESPPDRPEVEGMDAIGVFAGYLVLDALVANQDRHDHNWSVLVPPGKDAVRLAPSYDHASSLGFNLTDAERERRLADGSLEAWASRGRALRFEHQPPASAVESLVALAARACRRADAPARARWTTQVGMLDMSLVAEVFYRMPMLSLPAATFAIKLIETNQQRLIEALNREADE
jgi:hypothetical protein